jgi:hypothetical protein
LKFNKIIKLFRIDDESGIPIFSAAKKLQEDGEEAEKRPGDPGFVPRARVPKLSTRDYVVRPRPEIEAQFRGETKNKQVKGIFLHFCLNNPLNMLF